MTGSPGQRPSPLCRAALLLIAICCASSAPLVGAQSAPAEWAIDPAASRLTVRVAPAGLLSSALHAHQFRPESWSGEIRWDPDRPERVHLEIRIAADSLRDHEEGLSAKDVAKVEAQTRGPRILDAAKFPSIRFEGRELSSTAVSGTGEVRATLNGDLTLHGRTRGVQFPVQGRVSGDRIEASATVKLRQSDFGIKPYSTALGSIAVRDEITIEISLVAVRRQPATGGSASSQMPAR